MTKKDAKERKQKRQGMDLGRVLLWSAVLVEAPRWAGAMLAADVSEIYPWLSATLNMANTVAGAFMGILVVVATAYLLDALRSTKLTMAVRRNNQTVDRQNPRFWGLMVFVVGLLGLTPFVLGPYIVSRMRGENIASVLHSPGWQYTWAVMVVIAPAFVIGGVAFAQPGLVRVGGQAPESSPEEKSSPRSVSGKPPESGSKPPEVYRSFGDVPELLYTWISEASPEQIATRFRLDGKDPLRKARDWRGRAEQKLKLNGHQKQDGGG